ncbi:RHS repeat-associated core domain-containing protein [Xanthomonas sp. NCPPB 2632]|uniref:RHS repeat-associated core domain-containing protein n=1 Tax=Xanthomonas sp. NCPPB 2632 TaxID=3240912 RepID=UPI0035144B32
MRHSFFTARRYAIGVFLCLIGLFGAVGAQAKSYYGPPYNYSIGSGGGSNFNSAAEAAQAMIAGEQRYCPTCAYSITYNSNTQGEAAIVLKSGDLLGYVWGTETTGYGPRNAGGCSRCSSGNGDVRDSSGPQGSMQDGVPASSMPSHGPQMVGDPINATTANVYRQDTDYRSPSGLTFRRFYNTKSFVQSPAFAKKWRHTFDRSLQLMLNSGNAGTGVIQAKRPDGSMMHFVGKGGVWTVDKDSADRLEAQVAAGGASNTGFLLHTAATHETEAYDANGRLLSVVDDRTGQTTALMTYSDTTTPTSVAPKSGLLIAVTDETGRQLGLRYDASARLVSLVLPDATTVGYAYDAGSNLSRVTYPDGSSRQYLYAETAYSPSGATYPWLLTGIIDEKGARFETTTYASNGAAISTQFAGGVEKTSVSYANYTQNGGTPSDVTYPLGVTVTHSFTEDGSGALVPTGVSAQCGAQCHQQWKSQTYDANGYPASYTDFRGTVTKTTYDANGFLTQQVEASGTDAQRTTSTTYDAAIRAPLSEVMSDSKGVVLAKRTWTYNTRGQPLAECIIDPALSAVYTCGSQAQAPQGARQTTYAYCDAVDGTQCPLVGLLLTVDGPRSDVADVTRYAYYLTADESGCGAAGGACHRAGDLVQVINAAGHVTTVLSYDRHGHVARQKDANGVITDTTYTPRGWVASRTVRASPDGSASSADATTTWTYDAVGALTAVADADGVTLTYGYDTAHRLVDVADATGSHIHYTLDVAGNRLKDETFDAQGVSRRVLSRKFNALGQLASVTDGLGHVVFDATASGSYDANGNLVSAKDALGTVQKSGYDGLDRVVSSVANANGTDASSSSTTKLSLDALDQVKSVTDPDGLVTSYGFDGLSNPVSLTSPDTGAQSSTFDTAGNALTQTDAKSTVASQSFDALGRKTSVSYTDAKPNAAFHYDEAMSVTGCVSSFPIGHLTRVVENTVTTVYCYDNQGRVTEERQTQGTVTDTTDYVYTKAGRLAAVASPSGLVTEYARDALGQVTKVTVTPAKGVATTVVSAATYLPFGPVASYTLGNGQTVARSYDANYRFTDIVSPALNLHVARDAVGNIVALGNAAGASPASETYTYDPLYRLTGVKNASGTLIEAYTYSKTGDRLTKTAPGLATGTYGYQSGTHRLTTIGTGSRTYDANGSTTGNASAGTAWGYGYSGRGQLTVLQQAGSTVATYTYDASAHRIAKTVGSATTRFAYGPGGLLGEYGAASRDYVWMDGTPVAVVDGTTTVAFVHADGLNTPRAVTDASGTVLWTWAYQGNPFGEQAPTSTNGYVLNLRFAGQYWDRESGFLYNIHRYYDSTTGRYIQSDPMGLAAGITTYSYVGGMPLIQIDPDGLEGIGPWTFAPGAQRDEYEAYERSCETFDYDAFADYVRDNAIDPSIAVSTLATTLGIGTMPKTAAELRGLGIAKTAMNPYTSQLSRWSGRFGTRSLRLIGRTGAGVAAGAIATGATIFEGFYDLSIEGQAAAFATKTKVCGCK